MRYIRVSKLVGTGNDFIFIDARADLPTLDRVHVASRLCDRHFGVGADGVVFVENSSLSGRLKWDFYNSDGSSAEMCGNASRCMGRWAQKNMQLERVEFETVAGVVRSEIEGAEVRTYLDALEVKFEKIDFEVRGSPREAMLVNTGVPHAVVETTGLVDHAFVKASRELETVRMLRFHEKAGARGANVTFLEKLKEKGPDQFASVTFERGVEGFTLSCGTGVLAAAATGLKGSEIRRASVATPGGLLTVEFGPGFKGGWLQGPANIVFETDLSEEFFK